jgi:hypothetical protein
MIRRSRVTRIGRMRRVLSDPPGLKNKKVVTKPGVSPKKPTVTLEFMMDRKKGTVEVRYPNGDPKIQKPSS